MKIILDDITLEVIINRKKKYNIKINYEKVRCC